MLTIFLFFIFLALIAGAAAEVFPLILEALWVVGTVIIEVLFSLIAWLWKQLVRYFEGHKAAKQRKRCYEEFEPQKEKTEQKNRHTETPSRRLNDYQLALLLLGLGEEFSKSDLKLAYRRVMHWAHPDKYGSTEVAQNINRAREIIKQRRGW